MCRTPETPLRESGTGIEASSYQSYPDYLDLRDRNHTFDGLTAFSGRPGGGSDTGEAKSRVLDL